MPNEQLNQVSENDSDPRVPLAFERTLLAYERTQIAWVRTALALISFGFAISTFFSYLREQRGERATVLSPRAVGLTMIVIALIGLILATWRQQRALKLLRRRCPGLPAPIGGHVMAGMIAFVGILALLADLIR
jgi:putative membrane protein